MTSHIIEDRRLQPRFTRHGLMVRIGQALTDIDDISIGGLRAQGIHGEPGTSIDLQLIPVEGRQLDLPRAVWLKGRILAHAKGQTRIIFTAINYGIARFIINRLAQKNSTTPYIFK